MTAHAALISPHNAPPITERSPDCGNDRDANLSMFMNFFEIIKS